MTNKIIPDSAPFSSEQRSWLNGFLAGWTGLIEAPATPFPGPDVNPQAALALASLAGGAPVEEEEDFPWHDDSLLLDERLSLAEGKPLERRLMASMAQLDCGACGYVCKTYSEAIARGEEKNLTLCTPGGKETSKSLKQQLKEAAAAGEEATAAAESGSASETAAPSSAYDRNNPFHAILKESRNLNGEGSSKHTRHVVIDLTGSDLAYRVGDALGVYPTNCPELVEEILGHVRFDRENCVGGQLREGLLEKYDLNEVAEELMELLISAAADPAEKSLLSQLLEEDAFDDFDVLDILRKSSSAELEPAQFFECLSPMKPRLYSIASSLSAHPNEVHLTIARVESDLGGRLRKGVASTMFSDRLQPGDHVRVFLHKSASFTVPANPDAPMIMVGPGTGVAPFRAFLQERHSTKAPGKNWLFFGDQRESTDFLYRDELESLRQESVLTKLDTAFSRDQEEKIYVQNRMQESGSELYQWLSEGAYFFVCGDAGRMAVDVDRALTEVVQTHGAMTAEQASDYVKQLKKDNRYVRDVY